MFNVDFSQPLIQAEEHLRDILRPRVFLVQDNPSLLFQNLAIKHNFAFFSLYRHSITEISAIVRRNSFRNVIIAGYRSSGFDLISKDFFAIEKNIGPIRYLSIWSPEATESHDEPLTLERPAEPVKPKAAEGEEGEAPPPAEEEG